jgi:hypothetical protein
MFSVEVMTNERKSILSTYAKLYSMQTQENEPRWNMIVQYIQQDKNIIQCMQNNIAPFAERIAKLCYLLKEQVDLSFNLTGDGFRNIACLSLTPQFSGIKAPPKDENEKVCIHDRLKLLVSKGTVEIVKNL